MSKYIKLEDAIEAYNQAVTLLVESEMEEFNLGDFTECSFNTTQIKLIARMIESLPTIEVSEDAISRATALEIYSDLYWIDERLLNFKSELDKVYDDLRNAPSVVPTQTNTNQCVQRVEYVGDIEKKRCRTCKHFKSEFHTPISSDGTYYTYVICTEKECIYKEKG